MNQIAKQKVLAVVVAAALLALGLFWTLSRGDTLGEMKLLVGVGSVTIQRGDEALPVGGGEQADIAPGDVVSTARDSQATVRLEGERRLMLDERSSVEILGVASVESVDGTVIADADNPMKVSLGDTVARAAKSRFRVDREAGTTRAGVYTGRLELTAPGSPILRLNALWQTTVVADRLYGSEPYRLEIDDPWDQQFLDHLVDLDRELTDLRRGYIGEIAGTAPSLAYFDTQAKGEVSFMKRYVRDLSPKKPGYTADLMINFFLAKHAPGGSLAKNFDEGFGYFRKGASWGITAGLLGLDDQDEWRDARKDLRVAIYGTSGVGGSGGEGPSFAVEGDATSPEGDTVDGAPTDTGGDPGDSPGDPGPAPPPEDPPEPTEDPDPTDDPDPSPPPCDVQCEVEKIIQPSPDPTRLLDPPPIGR